MASQADLDALDAILDDMTTKLPTTTTQASRTHIAGSERICAGCGKNILGFTSVDALGKHWHAEHFTCCTCRRTISADENFYDMGDKGVRCSECTHGGAPVCAGCGKKVMGNAVTQALGKHWHPEHFACTTCHTQLGGNFYEHNGMPYCQADFDTVASSDRCEACGKVIMGPVIQAMGKKWHPEHLACTVCHASLNDNFYEYLGKPYCDEHYGQVAGSTCNKCRKPVAGRCLTAGDKKFHPECFVCCKCGASIKGSYYDRDDAVFCPNCPP